MLTAGFIGGNSTAGGDKLMQLLLILVILLFNINADRFSRR